MSQIRQYHNDLSEYFAGDDGRFVRMVTDGGKQLPSASPQGWANHIQNLAIDCVDLYHAELAAIFAQLKTWGLNVNEDLFNDEVQR